MALQSSGQISLDDIRTELGLSQSNVSLGTMSDTAGFSAPDLASDFYGYSSAPASYSFTGSIRYNSSSVACMGSVNQTYYHNNGSGGSTTYVALNDYVYSDSAMTTKLVGGYYKVSTPDLEWIRVNGFGRAYDGGICD